MRLLRNYNKYERPSLNKSVESAELKHHIFSTTDNKTFSSWIKLIKLIKRDKKGYNLTYPTHSAGRSPVFPCTSRLLSLNRETSYSSAVVLSLFGTLPDVGIASTAVVRRSLIGNRGCADRCVNYYNRHRIRWGRSGAGVRQIWLARRLVRIPTLIVPIGCFRLRRRLSVWLDTAGYRRPVILKIRFKRKKILVYKKLHQ